MDFNVTIYKLDVKLGRYLLKRDNTGYIEDWNWNDISFGFTGIKINIYSEGMLHFASYPTKILSVLIIFC